MSVDRRAIVDALLGDDPDLMRRYRHRGSFHQGVDAAIMLLEHTIVGLTIASDADANRQRQAMRAQGLSRTWIDRHLDGS